MRRAPDGNFIRLPAKLEGRKRYKSLIASARLYAPKRLEKGGMSKAQAMLNAFVKYFNRTMAKPFRWTYQAKPLAA